MGKEITRREILGGAAASALLAGKAAAATAGQTRMLGRTGTRPSIIAMGCGESWWRHSGDEETALGTLTLALDSGITYLDTGQTYGKGTSETWVGKGLKGRRDGIFVATKISTRDPDEAMRETERSLQRLQTGQIDLLHIHNLQGEEDLARIERKGGLLDAVRKMRDQKITRFIGITSHLNPATLKTAIERHDFDCVQMALNAAMQGHYDGQTSRPGHSYESMALPVARKKNMGIIAMKVTGRNNLVGASPEKSGAQDLIRYALSLPISVAVVGMGEAAHVRQNAELARTFQPMPEAEMKSLSGRMAANHKIALDRFFSDHLDA
jgi:uncharacterized protein